jgi:hypothetical protein
MKRDEMLRLFEAHREAEAARDVDAILTTFVEDCFLETMALGLRAEGKGRRPFKDGLMAGEAVYFDLATLCEQAGLNTDEVRAAAKARA